MIQKICVVKGGAVFITLHEKKEAKIQNSGTAMSGSKWEMVSN